MKPFARHTMPSRREILAGSVGALALAAAPSLAAKPADADHIARLMRLEVRLAHWVREHRKQVLSAPPDGPGEAIPWADYGFKWPAYTLAHLWSTPHADNPLVGADWCPELAMELYDKEVSGWLTRRDRGGGISTYETPHYVAAYLLQTLGDRIPRDRRQRWLAHEQAWVDQALVRPLGRTGRYHDSWRFTGLYRLGQVLDRPEWTKRGIELFHEMLKYQLPEGFWSEQRGPSFRYHGLMLPSLAWMYRWTGDEAFGDAARRLVQFLTRYVHPDAIAVGPFDVRNSNVMAYFPVCGGLELTAEGRAFAARAFRLWEDLGMMTDVSRSMVCTRDVARLAFYVADTVRYLSQYAPQEAQAASPRGSLPIDRDGVQENHTAAFDGLLFRRGSWVVALSGQNPDYSRQSKSPYMLDGQSRIELWNTKGRLAIGGGHSHRTSDIPFANVFIASEAEGDSQFGKPDPKLSRDDRIACYMPQAVEARVVEDVPQLTLTFRQGAVRYRIHRESDRQVRIDADWDLAGAKILCLQMPLVVWRGAKLVLDGAPQSGALDEQREVKREAQVRGGPFESSLAVQMPAGAECRVHYPLVTGQFHDNPWLADPMQARYDLALLSCQWTAPQKTGRAAFVISV